MTRAIWMLVRSGDLTPKTLVCSASDDEYDRTENIPSFYDFADHSNISYGFQVPFGPPSTRAGENADSRMAVAADKGPYGSAVIPTPPLSLASPTNGRYADTWQPYNTTNHGGVGQNVLFADGHVDFWHKPVVGVDGDNIYTVALDNTTEKSRTHGESPWTRSAHPFQPKLPNGDLIVSTDSLIFP